MSNSDMLYLVVFAVLGGMSLGELARRFSWWTLAFTFAYAWCAGSVILSNWSPA